MGGGMPGMGGMGGGMGGGRQRRQQQRPPQVSSWQSKGWWGVRFSSTAWAQTEQRQA